MLCIPLTSLWTRSFCRSGGNSSPSSPVQTSKLAEEPADFVPSSSSKPAGQGSRALRTAKAKAKEKETKVSPAEHAGLGDKCRLCLHDLKSQTRTGCRNGCRTEKRTSRGIFLSWQRSRKLVRIE